MRHTSVKIIALAAIAIAFLAVAPAASANSIDVENIFVNGTQIGTATLTQGGTNGCSAAASNVCVSITMSGSNLVRVGGPTVGFSGNINQGGSSAILNSSLTLTNLHIGACGNLGTTLCFDTNGSVTGSSWTFVLSNADANTGIQLGLHVVSTSCAGGNTCFATFGPGTPPPTVPEPGTISLLGTGLVGLAGMVRRRLSR